MEMTDRIVNGPDKQNG